MDCWLDTLLKSEFMIDSNEATGGKECGGMSVNIVEPALHVPHEEESVEPSLRECERGDIRLVITIVCGIMHSYSRIPSAGALGSVMAFTVAGLLERASAPEPIASVQPP